MHSFLVSVPQAAALWVVMLGGVLFAASAIARVRQPSRPAAGTAAGTPAAGTAAGTPAAGTAAGTPAAGISAAAAPRVGPDRPDAAGARAGLDPRVAGDPGVADELRFADEMAVAAERAAATAARRRVAWESAQDRLDDAWAAFDEADRAARQAAKASAYPLISKRRKPGENVLRERYLHHAATVACRNREISIAQLNDVFAHRGWNPRLHPVVQESMLRQAIRAHRFDEYRKAVEAERAAWQEAESAAEALRSLRLEAAVAVSRAGAPQPAADEQWWAEQWTTAELPAAA